MLLITIFVELRVVAGKNRTRAGSPQAVSRRQCCAVVLRRMAWSEHGMGAAWAWHGMASLNQTRTHCVNKMGKTHSKPLAARHGKGTAWARHGHSMLYVNRPLEYQLNCRPGEPANRLRLYGENSLALPGIEIRFLGDRPVMQFFLCLINIGK